MLKFIYLNLSYLASLGLVKVTLSTVEQSEEEHPIDKSLEKFASLLLSFIPCAIRINSPGSVQFTVKLRSVEALTASKGRPHDILPVSTL